MEWNREIMQKPMWKEEISNREEKEKIARRMAEKVQDGEVVGFGSVSLADMVESEQKSHSACGEGGTAVKPSATCSCGSCPANCECSSGSQKKQK